MSCAMNGYALGLAFILLDCAIWAGASVLMQHVYDGMDFRSPFFMTFFTNSLLTIYLPTWYLWVLVGQRKRPTVDPFVNGADIELAPISKTEIHGYMDRSGKLPSSCADISVLRIALYLAPIYFLSNGFYNYSILMTSISSSTIISNLSGTFAFTFSWYLGMEGFSCSKVLGILACFLGAACVGLSDAGDGTSVEHTVIGDAIALLAAVFFGMYTAVLKYLIPDDDVVPMQLLLGYIGLINAVVLAPVLLFLWWSGAENLSHLTWIVFGYMCISGLSNNVISDYLWARSVLLTSSTVATVGLSLTIPMAMAADFVFQSESPTVLSAIGAGLVILGFCLVNIGKETEVGVWSALLGGAAYQQIADMPA